MKLGLDSQIISNWVITADDHALLWLKFLLQKGEARHIMEVEQANPLRVLLETVVY